MTQYRKSGCLLAPGRCCALLVSFLHPWANHLQALTKLSSISSPSPEHRTLPFSITGGGTEPDGIEDNPLTWAWGLAPAPSSAVDRTLDLEPGTVCWAGLCR